VRCWERARALDQALRWPLERVRERAAAGHFSSGGEAGDSGAGAAQQAQQAQLLAWRFAPTLGARGVEDELRVLSRWLGR